MTMAQRLSLLTIEENYGALRLKFRIELLH